MAHEGLELLTAAALDWIGNDGALSADMGIHIQNAGINAEDFDEHMSTIQRAMEGTLAWQ